MHYSRKDPDNKLEHLDIFCLLFALNPVQYAASILVVEHPEIPISLDSGLEVEVFPHGQEDYKFPWSNYP
jgi:hypothetical protein